MRSWDGHFSYSEIRLFVIACRCDIHFVDARKLTIITVFEVARGCVKGDIAMAIHLDELIVSIPLQQYGIDTGDCATICVRHVAGNTIAFKKNIFG
jgi:hypothetical protein